MLKQLLTFDIYYIQYIINDFSDKACYEAVIATVLWEVRMGRSRKDHKLATRALEGAIDKPIATLRLTPKRLENFRLKLSDMTVGEHLRIEPPEGFSWEVKIFVLNIIAIDLLLDPVQRGMLKTFKDGFQFDQSIMDLHVHWMKTQKIFLASRKTHLGG